MREQRQGFEVKVGMHRVFVLLPFFFAVVVNVVTVFARVCGRQ